MTSGESPSPPPPDALGRARASALRLLAVRDRFRGELEGRLLARYPPQVAGRVVDELAEAGYLDDARLARHLAGRYAAERGFGPARIRHELMRRGLSSQAAGEALGEPDAEAVRSTALEAARRYLKGKPPPADPRAQRRLAGHLERRGFPADTIRAIVRLSRQGRLWDDD